MWKTGSIVAILLAVAAGPALARSQTPARMHGVSGQGFGTVSPFTNMSSLPHQTGIGRQGAVGEQAAQYGHVGGMVNGPGGGSGYSGASMKGTATGGATRNSPSPFLGAGAGGVGSSSGM